MESERSLYNTISRLLALAFAVCFLAPKDVRCQSLIAGTITDAVSGYSAIGVMIEIVDSGKIVGHGNSDQNGRYNVSFTSPSGSDLHTLSLMVKSDQYVAASFNFQIINGEPIGTIYNLSLLPKGLASCHSHAMHAIVVGHFRSPLGKEYFELPGRIAEALHFDLTTRMQTVHLPIELQPAFEPCDDASPRTIQFGKDLARALGAHAFLFGNISDERTSFAVSTYVSDAYMVFATPMISTSHRVNLNNPGGARMSGETHVAILAAMAAGLADKGDYRTAIAVIDAAAGLVDSLPRYIAKLRREWESRVPQTGLLDSRRP